jgi:hypothetical protein
MQGHRKKKAAFKVVKNKKNKTVPLHRVHAATKLLVYAVFKNGRMKETNANKVQTQRLGQAFGPDCLVS